MRSLLDEFTKLEYQKPNHNALLAPKKSESATEFWVIDYSHSKLRDLPEIRQEHLLSYEFNASHNKISFINPNVLRLRLLTYIDLSHNRIVSFPSVLCEFRYLKFLLLSKNMISSFPPEISKLTYLQELDFHCNQFREFPEAVCNIPGLRVLSAARNPLGFLPVAIGQMKALRCLDLRETRLVELPTQLQELKELEILMLEGTPLKIPPISIVSRGLSHIMAYLIHVAHGHRKLSCNPQEFPGRSTINLMLSDRSKDTLPCLDTASGAPRPIQRLVLPTNAGDGRNSHRKSSLIPDKRSSSENSLRNANSEIPSLLSNEVHDYPDPSYIHSEVAKQTVTLIDVTHSPRAGTNRLRPDSGYSTTGYFGGGAAGGVVGASGTSRSSGSLMFQSSADKRRRFPNLSDNAADSQSNSSDVPLMQRASVNSRGQSTKTMRGRSEVGAPPTLREKQYQQSTTGRRTNTRTAVSTTLSSSPRRNTSHMRMHGGHAGIRAYGTIKHPLASASQRQRVRNGPTTETNRRANFDTQASKLPSSSWLSTDSEQSSVQLSQSTNSTSSSHPVRSTNGLRARPKPTNVAYSRRERNSSSSTTKKNYPTMRSAQGTASSGQAETTTRISKPKRSPADSLPVTSFLHAVRRPNVKRTETSPTPPTRPAHSRLEPGKETSMDSRIGVSLRVQTEKALRSSKASAQSPSTNLNRLSTDRSKSALVWGRLSKDDMSNIMQMRQTFQNDLGIRLPMDTKVLAVELSNGLHLTNWLNHVLGPTNQIQFPFPNGVSASDPMVRNEIIKHLRRCREVMSVHGVPKDQLLLVEALLNVDNPLGLLSLSTSVLTLRSQLKLNNHQRPRSIHVTCSNSDERNTSRPNTPKSPKSTGLSPSPQSSPHKSHNPIASPSGAWPHHLCSDV